MNGRGRFRFLSQAMGVRYRRLQAKEQDRATREAALRHRRTTASKKMAVDIRDALAKAKDPQDGKTVGGFLSGGYAPF